MKIKPEHYNALRAMLATVPQEKIAAHREKLVNDPRVRDLDMRLRWDLVWAVVPSCWISDNLYPYMNDDHLDTALRAIVRELGINKTPSIPAGEENT